MDTVLGKTYGPEWKRLDNDQAGKAVITKGIISKIFKKSTYSPGLDVWDVELRNVPDAYQFPAWAIFESEEVASDVLAELRKLAKCD